MLLWLIYDLRSGLYSIKVRFALDMLRNLKFHFYSVFSRLETQSYKKIYIYSDVKLALNTKVRLNEKAFVKIFVKFSWNFSD